MQHHKIGIVGGTGKEGGGLAARLAFAGHTVTIGSRTADKARAAAEEFARLNQLKIAAGDNREAVLASDIVILTVPYSAQLATLESVKAELQDKILVDATVPLMPPRVSQVHLPKEGSAAVAAQAMLGAGVRVVSAFQNVSARHLRDLSHPVDCDVIVCGDDAAACEIVVDLARSIRLRAFYGGMLCNSAAIEAMTSVLIAINRRYKVVASGIQITGVPIVG
ncbi:MAG TPA: NADPH-dependent F420 reductase [Pseudolabrys sp.]|jgi:NADPH-dependent F420 reductase|nr:NADPH-dependent F420 reductase [Pseudolabrys sp.]